MRVIARGFDRIGIDVFGDHAEPAPYIVAKVIKDQLIVVETMSTLRPVLKSLLETCRNGENASIRRLLESIVNVPKSSYKDVQPDVDLTKYEQINLCDIFLDNNFQEFYSKLIRPVVTGMSRQEVFDSRLAPFIKTAEKIVIYDRFLGSQLINSVDNFGGFSWFLSELDKYGIKNLEIFTGAKVQNVDQDINQIKKSLGTFFNISSDLKLKITSGFIGHDRHIRFAYPSSQVSIAFTLGNGLETFRFESMKEAHAVVPLDHETAIANENSIYERRFKILDYS